MQDLVVLVKAVSSHGSIVELDLSCNVISDEGVECLAEYLKVTMKKSFAISCEKIKLWSCTTYVPTCP